MLESFVRGDFMRINSKDKFIKLFVCVMSKMGCSIETFNFEKELIQMMAIGKYDDLFYFFENISDLDFTEILLEMQRDGLIVVDYYTNGTRIEILNRLFYDVGDHILNKFDNHLVKLMEEMLGDLILSRSLSDSLPKGIEGTCRLCNPNRVYMMNESYSIVTDGLVLKTDKENTGAYIVQDASFVFMQRIFEDKLKEIQVYYKFDNRSFLLNKIREILEFYKRILGSYGEDILRQSQDYSYFEPLNEINGYRYKKN